MGTTLQGLVTPTGGINTLPLFHHASNQSSIAKNVWISELGNLVKRNPTVNYSAFVPTGEPYSYAYDRGDGEHAYLIEISELVVDANTKRGIIHIIDKNGDMYGVNYRPATNSNQDFDKYLEFPSSLTAREVFEIISIKDTLFILNKTKKVLSKEVFRYDIKSYLKNWAVWVKEVNRVDGYTYKLTFNNETAQRKQESADVVLRDISLAMTSNPLRMSGSISSAFGLSQDIESLSFTDDAGNTASSLIYNSVERLEDLPSDMDTIKYNWHYWEANDGEPYYLVREWTNREEIWETTEITRIEPNGLKLPNGDDGNNAVSDYTDNKKYLIVRVKEGTEDGYFMCHDRGEWSECSDPYDKVKAIDERTMPLMLKQVVKNDASSFSLYFMNLAEKHATVVNPPFVNDYIKNMVYYDGRIGMVTSNHVCLSQFVDSDQINFFNRTARDVLPADPLFYGLATSKNEDILEVKSFHLGLYIFTTDGIYINRLGSDKGESTNQIVKVLSQKIESVTGYGDSIVFASKGRLHIVNQNGEIAELSVHFRDAIPDIISLKAYAERDLIFMLRSDKKRLFVLQNKRSLFEWKFKRMILAMEVANDKLILSQENGVNAIDLIHQKESNMADNGTDTYQSIVELPSNLLGDGNKWSKYWWKRIRVFQSEGTEYRVRIVHQNESSSPTELAIGREENVVNGNNMDTKILVESIDDKPFSIEIIRYTIDIEPQIRNIK